MCFYLNTWKRIDYLKLQIDSHSIVGSTMPCICSQRVSLNRDFQILISLLEIKRFPKGVQNY